MSQQELELRPPKRYVAPSLPRPTPHRRGTRSAGVQLKLASVADLLSLSFQDLRAAQRTLQPQRAHASGGRVQPEGGLTAARASILCSMTRALDTAIAKLTTLPVDEHDRIAQWLLEELRDEEHWARQCAASQSALSTLAAEARAERATGRTTELDPDKP